MSRLAATCLFVAVGMAGASTEALAQSPFDHRLLCTIVGNNQPEPLSDKPGHTMATVNFSCRVENGVLDKGTATGHQIYEYNGPSAVGRAGIGVVRHPEGVWVWVNDQMKTDLQMKDGKLIGARSTGQGTVTMGSGKAKDMEGKKFNYESRLAGPGVLQVDATFDTTK